MQKWKTLKTETVFQAKPYVSIVKETVAVNDAVTIEDFYKVNLRPFVACVPILSDGNVLMLRQYKHGIGTITLTFPGGFVEEGEPADVACQRELLEETGYQSERLVPLGSFMDNGNQRGSLGTYFVAPHCTALQAADSGDLEEMELLTMSSEEVDRAMNKGDIHITHHAFAWLMAKQWLNAQV